MEGQGHFLALAQGHLHMQFKTCFSNKETTKSFWTKFCMNAFRYKEIKIHENDAVHMTKMAITSIYGKNPSKIFFSQTGGLISTKRST